MVAIPFLAKPHIGVVRETFSVPLAYDYAGEPFRLISQKSLLAFTLVEKRVRGPSDYSVDERLNLLVVRVGLPIFVDEINQFLRPEAEHQPEP